MTPADLLREVFYPFWRPMLWLQILFAWVMLLVAFKLGVPGLLLGLVTIIPLAGYLMHLLEERSMGREAPPFDAELMAFAGKPIGLFPLVVVAIAVWTNVAVAQKGTDISLLSIVLLLLIAPAFLGVLAVTRSPAQALNPMALFRFVQASGLEYLYTIVALAAVLFVLALLRRAGVAEEWLGIGMVYFLFVLYGLSGLLCASRDFHKQVDIPAPVGVTPDLEQRAGDRRREAVAAHAYGFASRGNRAGAFRHIIQEIQQEADPAIAWEWYFNRILRWEQPEHALFFGQKYLSWLLDQGSNSRAAKLIGQCLHINPEFRPARDDTLRAKHILDELGRGDLSRLLF